MPVGPIAVLQTCVDEWIKSVGVRYFDPMTNMALLAEEVGEVARVMARTYGEPVSYTHLGVEDEGPYRVG